MGRLGSAVWIVIALTAGACRHQGERVAAPNPDATVLVEVVSHFQGDVVIYLLRGSMRERLGSVTALNSAAFTFPYRRLGVTGSTQLLAYPIAGAKSYPSEPLVLQPGQSITWTLEANLSRSYLVIH